MGRIEAIYLRPFSSFEQVVKKLLKDTPLIDGHNDLPWNLRKFVHNRLSGLNLSAIEKEEPWSKSKWSHTDIPRLKAGLLGAQFWSAYVPCKAQHLDAVQVTLEQIDVIKRLVSIHYIYIYCDLSYNFSKSFIASQFPSLPVSPISWI
nr:unnamed protein product [Callosobruchus chinensis]